MIAAALLGLAIDSATVCIRDARSRAPVLDAQAIDSAGNIRLLAAACTSVPVGELLLRRIGYHPQRLNVLPSSITLVVYLVSSTNRPQRLDAQVVRGVRDAADMRVEASVARTVGTLTVGAAQSMGIGTVSGLLSALPYAAPRSARGETGFSLRGARREGVAITLDGLPLNDPATGIADVADLPLIMLGSATVALGSDPLGVGPGATGGVLALHSAPRRALSLRRGAFGQQSIEGAWRAIASSRVVSASAGYRHANNDFAFDNDAGAIEPNARVREHRVNNDDRRAVAAVGVAGGRMQSLLLVSTLARGMVGPANVRTYDADRSYTTRMLMRTQAAVGPMAVVAGVRGFALTYRDPTRPALNANSRAIAADLELRGAMRALAWRMGGGADRVQGSSGLDQSRGRAFAALAQSFTHDRQALQLGARIDAVGTLGAVPSFSAVAQRRVMGETFGTSRIDIGARVAQAVRVPTLYDLYFSAPQRLLVRTLRPERVSIDAEINSSATVRTSIGDLAVQTGVVARDTRDAIIWFPGNFGWSPANVGIERLRGAEGRMSVERAGGALSAWVTAYHTDLVTGALRIPTPYVARFAGGGQAIARAGQSTVSAVLRATGSRPFTAGPRNPAFELPGTTLLDIAVSHRVTARLLPHAPSPRIDALIALSLENATGVSWQSVRGFPSPGRAWAVNITLSPAAHP